MIYVGSELALTHLRCRPRLVSRHQQLLLLLLYQFLLLSIADKATLVFFELLQVRLVGSYIFYEEDLFRMLSPSTRVLFSCLGLRGLRCILKEVGWLMIGLLSQGRLLFLLGARANEIGRVIRVHVPRNIIRLEST